MYKQEYLRFKQLYLHLKTSNTISDINKITALMVACDNGHNDVVTNLLENGADVNIQDKNGKNSTHVCL